MKAIFGFITAAMLISSVTYASVGCPLKNAKIGNRFTQLQKNAGYKPAHVKTAVVSVASGANSSRK